MGCSALPGGWDRKTTMLLSFECPVSQCRLIRPFGWTAGGFHPGIDYATPVGTPIHAAVGGLVIRAGSAGRRGLRVVIQHARKILTTYDHNSSLLVVPGQRVNGGQLIAFSGVTGVTEQPHLHFGVVSNGALVNPVDAMTMGIDADTGEVTSYKFERGILYYLATGLSALGIYSWTKRKQRKRRS